MFPMIFINGRSVIGLLFAPFNDKPLKTASTLVGIIARFGFNSFVGIDLLLSVMIFSDAKLKIEELLPLEVSLKLKVHHSNYCFNDPSSTLT